MRTMSDAGRELLDSLIDEPTPVAQLEQRLRRSRRRRTRRLSAALAVFVAFIAVASVVLVRSRPDTKPSDTALPRVTTAAQIPADWRLIDYGDLRLAVPTAWQVGNGPPSSCAPPPTVVVIVFSFDQEAGCAGPGPSVLRIGSMNAPLSFDHDRTQIVNGWHIAALTGLTAPDQGYEITELGIELVFSNIDTSDQNRVIGTISPSTRRVVLDELAAHPNEPPTTPTGWKTTTLGGVSLATPADWPYVNLDDQSSGRQIGFGVCGNPDPADPMVMTGTGASPPCPHTPPSGLPADGAWLSLHRVDELLTNPSVSIHGQPVALTSVEPDKPVLYLRVPGDGVTMVDVTIGLGADPQIALQIVQSLTFR
jgi:hypothetical protein